MMPAVQANVAYKHNPAQRFKSMVEEDIDNEQMESIPTNLFDRPTSSRR